MLDIDLTVLDHAVYCISLYSWYAHPQGCFEEIPHALFSAVDSKGNRIAHLVAASGNTEVIKVCITVAHNVIHFA